MRSAYAQDAFEKQKKQSFIITNTRKLLFFSFSIVQNSGSVCVVGFPHFTHRNKYAFINQKLQHTTLQIYLSPFLLHEMYLPANLPVISNAIINVKKYIVFQSVLSNQIVSYNTQRISLVGKICVKEAIYINVTQPLLKLQGNSESILRSSVPNVTTYDSLSLMREEEWSRNSEIWKFFVSRSTNFKALNLTIQTLCIDHVQ